MGIKCDVVDIRRSELTTVRRIVPVWETPVLQALWGAGVSFVKRVVVDRAAPDANDEFARLSARYGPRNSDTPFVASVYGNFGPGVNALRREIEGAIGDSVEEPEPAAPEEPKEPVDVVPPQAPPTIELIEAKIDAGEDLTDEEVAVLVANDDSAGAGKASENDEDDARDLGITS